MLRRPVRKLIPLAIVAFWAAMTLLLLRREGLLPFMGPATQTRTPRVLTPSSTWMGIYLGDNSRIGFVNTNVSSDVRNGNLGAVFTVTAKLRLTLLAFPTEILISGAAWMPQNDSPADFDFKVKSGEHVMRLAATVANGWLDATIYTAGEALPLRVPVNKDLFVAGAMGTTTLNVPALKPGQEILIDTVDPMTFSVGKARVQCTGEETLEISGQPVKTKVITTSLNGMTTKAWVTDEEEVVRAETPFGFSLRKISTEEALRPIGAGDSSGLLQIVAITPTGRTPFRGAKRMTVRIGGLASDKRPPADDTQTAEGDAYTIAPPSAPPEKPVVDGAPPETLKSDAFIQADHEKIRTVAAEIVGAESDPWEKALAIYEWVFDRIAKKAVFSIPSALEVLESRAGDCNEHTVLFTALARAAGIPTRIAIGLVWSQELTGFYYHAWPEVYVGRWMPMDPTLGQPISDATHIKLVNGDIERWPQLLPYIGQLKIEVASVE